jgi:hypothetical protein
MNDDSDTGDDYYAYNRHYDLLYEMYQNDWYPADEREYLRRCLERPDATLIAKYKAFAEKFGPFQWKKRSWLSPGAKAHHSCEMAMEENFKLHNAGQCGFLIDEERLNYLFVADEGVFICTEFDFQAALCVAKSVDDAVLVFQGDIPPEGTIMDLDCDEVTTISSGNYSFFGFGPKGTASSYRLDPSFQHDRARSQSGQM